MFLRPASANEGSSTLNGALEPFDGKRWNHARGNPAGHVVRERWGQWRRGLMATEK